VSQLAAAFSWPKGKDNPWHGETGNGAPTLRSAVRVSPIVALRARQKFGRPRLSSSLETSEKSHMRVCMLAYSFYESDMRILRYTKTLAERGDVVDVIALRREGAPTFEVMGGVNVYRVQTRQRNERHWFDYLIRVTRFMFVSAFVLSRKHLSKPYDVIHVHSVPDFLVFSTLLAKASGAKVILDIHDILPEFFASKFGASKQSLKFKLLLLAEYLSVRFSDHVIIANDLWYERLVKRSAKADRCTAIVNYPDCEIFHPRKQPSADRGTFRITYPGTLNAHQGLDVAIHAVAKIKDEMPDLEFHIYGEGPAKTALVDLSAQLGLSHMVIFHEFLPCERIAEVMALSDLSVVPKRASSAFGNEAMSTKIMEFMSLGVPVIVSRTKVDSYYHDESRVRFFESEDSLDLANAILALRRDPELRQLLATNASEYVRNNNWQEKKSLYLQLVEGLGSRTRRVPKSVRRVVS
jgi:glycosyltransferase involved in cell wall biosynthesis